MHRSRRGASLPDLVSEATAPAVNIWTAWHLATLTVALVIWLGYTPIGWLAIAIPLVVALLSYLLVGQIFRAIGNQGLGVVAAAHGVRHAILALLGTGVAVGWLVAGGALAATLTYFIVYPLAYVIVRLVGVLERQGGGLHPPYGWLVSPG